MASEGVCWGEGVSRNCLLLALVKRNECINLLVERAEEINAFPFSLGKRTPFQHYLKLSLPICLQSKKGVKSLAQLK